MRYAQPFLLPADDSPWTRVLDGNVSAFELFRRHYSFSRSARVPLSETRIAGPGQKLVLLTAQADAVFVWRKFDDKCIDERTKERQRGVNCAVFRNESLHLSSALILEAMRIGWEKWAGERFYTYVNPRRVNSRNPGYCFLRAGWRRCGYTKSRRLLILEALPTTNKAFSEAA